MLSLFLLFLLNFHEFFIVAQVITFWKIIFLLLLFLLLLLLYLFLLTTLFHMLFCSFIALHFHFLITFLQIALVDDNISTISLFNILKLFILFISYLRLLLNFHEFFIVAQVITFGKILLFLKITSRLFLRFWLWVKCKHIVLVTFFQIIRIYCYEIAFCLYNILI